METGLRLGGLIFISAQKYANHLSIKQKGTYRILCLGESTTAKQYPSFLQEILNQRNIGIKFSVIDAGTPAASTSYILEKLESNLETYHPDMVISMMGINDYGFHLPYEAVSGSKTVNLLKSFRVYNLFRILGLHIVTRLGELKTPKAALPQVDTQGNGSSPGKGSLEIDHQDDTAYIELSQVYREQGRFSDAEAAAKKAIEINPKNGWAYFMLGQVYHEQGDLLKAEVALRQAVEFNPKDDVAYVELTRVYTEQGRGRFSDAEAAAKKAIEINPQNSRAYFMLGQVYCHRHDFSEAEASFKEAVEINPQNSWAYYELGQIYRQRHDFPEAEASLKKAVELRSQDDLVYGALEVLYIETGKSRLARESGKKLKELRLSYYNPVTTDNYHKLKATLNKRGIVYVCMQYPMRNLEPLKKIFQGNAGGIIFVDNERIFKGALRQGGYKEYFNDCFGGNFGHCTDKGNKILAENIASVILKEVFGK